MPSSKSIRRPRGIPTKRHNKVRVALRKAISVPPSPTGDGLLDPDDHLVRKEWLAEQMGVSVYTVKRMVAEGEFPRPTVEIGNRQRWRVRDYREWLRQKATDIEEAV